MRYFLRKSVSRRLPFLRAQTHSNLKSFRVKIPYHIDLLVAAALLQFARAGVPFSSEAHSCAKRILAENRASPLPSIKMH
jgi:hypothetical protein